MLKTSLISNFSKLLFKRLDRNQMYIQFSMMSLKSIARILICLSEALLSHGVLYDYRGGYKAAVYPYSTSINPFSTCEPLCDSDPACNGYSIDNNNGCYLSRCDTHLDVPSCSSCKFASKLSPLSSPVCTPETTTPEITTVDSVDTTAADTTTIDSEDTTTVDIDTSTAASTEVSTEHSPTTSTPMYSTSGAIQTTGNTSCVCVCEEVDITLEESIEKRRKELVIDKTELSASIRKLISAPDYRVSSRTIGFVGILVMVVFGLLSFCTDISSVLLFLYRKFKNRPHK